MDNSFYGGHKIERLEGNADVITTRGAAMEHLGQQMREAAHLLQQIANGTEGRGYSMKKIKDEVGDAHEDLKKAGERYEPSGTVLRQYGEALGSVKSSLNTIVGECEELWSTYQSSQSLWEQMSGANPPEDETEEERAAREGDESSASGDAQSAFTAWKEKTAEYDPLYSTWESAYEDAYNGLKNANDDGVEDSTWENMTGFIDALTLVLQIAGIVLAIACIVIGGPILAIAAAVVGLLALGLEILKMAKGTGNWGDLGWAIVGVLPFGRLAKFASGAEGFSAFAKGFGADLVGYTSKLELNQFRSFAGSLDDLARNSRGNLTQGQNFADSLSDFRSGMRNLAGDTSALGGRNLPISSRIFGGPNGHITEGLGDLINAAGPNSTLGRRAVNNLGDAISDPHIARSWQESAGNFVDSVGKTSQQLWDAGGDAYDAITDPVGGWENELASSRR